MPITTAAGMAIIKEPKIDEQVPLEEAHLDKFGELVDANEVSVGFSTGGNTSEK